MKIESNGPSSDINSQVACSGSQKRNALPSETGDAEAVAAAFMERRR